MTYEVEEEARCRQVRNEHSAPTPDHTTPVTSTTVMPYDRPHCGVVVERRMVEETLPSHLEDLVSRSTTHLSEEQNRKICQTLAQ